MLAGIVVLDVVVLSAAPDVAGDTEAPQRPEAMAVARRALVLRAVYAMRLYPRRGEVSHRETIEQFEHERSRIVAWLRREKLLEHASPWEKSVLHAPVGSVSAEDGARISRQRIALEVMLFALGQIDHLPPGEGGGQRRDPKRKPPRLGGPTAKFIRSSTLRSRSEIDRAHRAAVLWHWRAETHNLIANKKFPEGEAFEHSRREIEQGMRRAGLEPRKITDGITLFQEIIRFSSHWAHREGIIAAPIDADFPVGDQPYREVDEKTFRRLGVSARARHRALNWLTNGRTNRLSGKDADWDTVPADV